MIIFPLKSINTYFFYQPINVINFAFLEEDFFPLFFIILTLHSSHREMNYNNNNDNNKSLFSEENYHCVGSYWQSCIYYIIYDMSVTVKLWIKVA